MRLLAIVSFVAGLMVACLWITAAGAADTPKVTATVKELSPTSRLVRIVNRDDVTYREFVVQTVSRPKLIAVTRPCAIRRDGGSNGVTFIWRYRATCRKALAPGRTFDIRLTTSGRGKIDVYVVVKGALLPIRK